MEKVWDDLGELEASLEKLKVEGQKLNAKFQEIHERGRFDSYAEFEAMIEKYAQLIRAHSKLELKARGLQAETVYMKVKGRRTPVA